MLPTPGRGTGLVDHYGYQKSVLSIFLYFPPKMWQRIRLAEGVQGQDKLTPW
jgi:hypothetical protein